MNKKIKRKNNKNIKKVIDYGAIRTSTMEQQEHHEGHQLKNMNNGTIGTLGRSLVEK
jgi:hypothetical protein